MKNNEHTAIEMLIVIIVLGVFTIGVISMTSYAFQDKSVDYFNEISHLAEKQAVLYASTLNNLKEEETMIITLNDLVEAGYYIADDNNGNVNDPRNSKATLNGLKIKLIYNNGDIKANIIEDE